MSVHGFHGSFKKKSLPKKTPSFKTVHEFRQLEEYKPRSTGKSREIGREKIAQMFREHPEIEETGDVERKSEKEALMTEMLKKYAHSYPQNQVILSKIVEANIRKVELSNTHAKAKEKINAVISQCTVY
eukprot:TRINITY_DN9524_c0_g1_i8.p1 TRINITY_DN9524_c0_g1~~TRINITY_DN9524_c0_g1_i8.p1  ORF type:complete len:129 (+),score=23.92 TRINITY_DN9524_c0_g1_i8:367-753(+)